jgi:hypothetical protein
MELTSTVLAWKKARRRSSVELVGTGGDILADLTIF